MEEEEIEARRALEVEAPFFFDAYLPFFGAFFVSFLAFFAMTRSCGLVSRGCVDADDGSFIGIRVVRVRVKNFREMRWEKAVR